MSIPVDKGRRREIVLRDRAADVATAGLRDLPDLTDLSRDQHTINRGETVTGRPGVSDRASRRRARRAVRAARDEHVAGTLDDCQGGARVALEQFCRVGVPDGRVTSSCHDQGRRREGF
jgi:hypothetical protein